MRTKQSRTTKIQFSSIAKTTQKTLVIMLSIFISILFITYLALINTLSIKGYKLTQTIKSHSALSEQIEELETHIAKLQTKIFISNTSKGVLETTLKTSSENTPVSATKN